MLTFVSCGGKGKDSKIITAVTDTSKSTNDFEIEKINLVINEKDLSKISTGDNEIRFYYFQPLFIGLYEFYKVNFLDSVLTLKKFTLVDQAGMGNDSIYTTKNIKLNENNINTISNLFNKSLFWNLKNHIESELYFDANTYIYESVKIKSDNEKHDNRHYHFVYCYAPQNEDFINFGQYLRKLAGQKNIYQEQSTGTITRLPR